MGRRQIFFGFLTVAILLILASVPWVVQVLNDPLLPDDLVETVTLYGPTLNERQTRDKAQERSAPSTFVTLPPEDVSYNVFNGDGDSKLQPVVLQSTTELPLTPFAIEVMAPFNLVLYSCPSLIYQTTEYLPANTIVRVQGWNRSEDGRLFLLVSYPTVSFAQVWLEFRQGVSYVELSNFESLFPEPTACILTITSSPTPTVTLSPTPRATLPDGVTLPSAYTATPLATSNTLIEITTEQIRNQIQNQMPSLRNINVILRQPDQINVTGNLTTQVFGNHTSTIPVEVIGHLEVIQGELVFQVDTMSLGGRETRQPGTISQIEGFTNRWLRHLIRQQYVTDFSIDSDTVLVDVGEPPQEVIPSSTPSSEVSPTLDESET